MFQEALVELGQRDHVVIFIDEFDEIALARDSIKPIPTLTP